jgi:hypothetical protein
MPNDEADIAFIVGVAYQNKGIASTMLHPPKRQGPHKLAGGV